MEQLSPSLCWRCGAWQRLRQRDAYDAAAAAILQDLELSGCENIILSGEEFSTLKAPLLQIFQSTFLTRFVSIKVLLYVRNLYRFLSSLVAQYSRGGDVIASPEWAMRWMRDFNPTKKLQTWEQLVGQHNVVVECVDALQPESGVSDSFARHAGVHLLHTGANAANRSIDPVASVLLSHLAFEFGLPASVFYRAYFTRFQSAYSMPKTELHNFKLMTSWVEAIDLSHDKLLPFESLLRKMPELPPKEHGDRERLITYLGSLAEILKESEPA